MAENQDQSLQQWRAPFPEPYAPEMMQPLQVSADRQDYLSMFLRRKWIMLGVLAIVFGFGMLYTLTQRPIYESSARLVVASNIGTGTVAENELPLLSDLRALTRSRSVDTQVEMISSPDLLNEAYESLAPTIRSEGFGETKLPDWSVKVEARKNTDVIVITGRAYTPTAAAALANTIANNYFKRDLARNSQAARQSRKYAGEQMEVVRKQLAEASADLAAYKRRTGMFAPDAQLAQAAEQRAQLALQLDAAKAQLAAEQRQVTALHRELSAEQQNVITNTTIAPNPQHDAIRQRIDSLISRRAELLQEYTPQSREIREIDERIKFEQQRLKQVDSTIVSAKVRARNPVWDNLMPTYANLMASFAADTARVRALQAALAEKQTEAQALPERERGLSERLQRVALLQRTYETLVTKYNSLLLAEQATLPTGMLVSSARAADEPAYPNYKTSGIMFLIIGILAAIAAALVADRADRHVHDEQSAEQMTHLPSLSVVPRADGYSPLLSSDGQADPAILESFRILRNSICLAGDQPRHNVIAVTSPGRQEGKSTTSINLAIAMAMEGKRVLLIDADMRRPSLHKLVGVSNESGLSTLLVGSSSLSEVIRLTNIENVECLPAGPPPPNAAELLNSDASRNLFRSIGNEYDVVVVDCPPSAGLSDVQVISTLVDGVLLVVSIDQTLKPQLDITIRALRRTGAPLLGIVLNRMRTRYWGYDYYSYCTAETDNGDSGSN